MALYIRHSIFHLARLLYVRPETFVPYCVLLKPRRISSEKADMNLFHWCFKTKDQKISYTYACQQIIPDVQTHKKDSDVRVIKCTELLVILKYVPNAQIHFRGANMCDTISYFLAQSTVAKWKITKRCAC